MIGFDKDLFLNEKKMIVEKNENTEKKSVNFYLKYLDLSSCAKITPFAFEQLF